MDSLDVLKVILNTCEAAACITGFIVWRKIKTTHWKWFPFYLAFIVVAELTGKYFTYTHMDELKRIMYDYIVIPSEILFYLFIFYNEFKHTEAARLPFFCAIIYIICLLIDSFYLAGKYDWFLSFSYTVGVILLVVNILFFLFRLVASKEIIYFRTNFMFWVCIGLLLFYLGSIPFQGILNTLFEKYNKLFMHYVYLFYIFNYLMYLSFVTAFIWGKVKSQDF
jgi:hypothetical protein